MKRILLCAALLAPGTSPVVLAQDTTATPTTKSSPDSPNETALPGAQMVALGSDGARVGMCPLEKTEVRARLSGTLGRTVVSQTFANPFDSKIEALYTFPLPPGAAVDGFTLRVGTRTIRGEIQTRERAREIYEAAKRRGKVAALLDQQRPNLFSQTVANILPGQKITVEISYTETLRWADGDFEWNFPLTVGPAFSPATGTKEDATTEKQTATAPHSPTDLPGELKPGAASFDVQINAGAPLQSVESPSHAISVAKQSGGDARVTLADGQTVPNRDFVLRFRTASQTISDSFITHTDSRGGYFSLALSPPRRVTPAQTRAKELLFVVDRSGSMDGFALDAAKKTMRRAFDALRPNDTFNVFSFSFGPEACFEGSVAATEENRKIAARYLDSLEPRGGTEMLPAIREALDEPRDAKRARVVVIATDGWVSDDLAIVDAVQKASKSARVFSFGVGAATNRFLLDGLALAGRGEAEYISAEKDEDVVAARFVERIDAPILSDISIDWGTVPVKDVYPRALPDLFASKPLVIAGRLSGSARGTITLRGRTGSGPFERKIVLNAPVPVENEAIASVWARQKVGDLLARDLTGLQYDRFSPVLKKQIETLGLSYHLLTQFTSFVAVDEKSDTGEDAPKPVKVEAPTVAKSDPASGSDAAKDAADADKPTPYAATAGGGFSGRAGDPLLRVMAPENSRQVVAQMPDGELKPLAWNALSRAWEASFDIPTYAPDGDYQVSVAIVHADGVRSKVTLRFRVANQAPHAKAAMREDGAKWNIEVADTDHIQRVVALLPWGERLMLEHEGALFRAAVAIPATWSGARRVQLVVTDTAHNRTTIEVDESR